MVAASHSVALAKDEIGKAHSALAQTLASAISKLTAGGMDEPAAAAKACGLLISEVSKVVAGAADTGRAQDSRTFEAMFDVDAASSHFGAALEQGVQHAADEIARDGYARSSALTLAVSRALDAAADILR